MAMDTLLLYLAYSIQGMAIAGLNMPTMMAILRQDALRSRKEYTIISGKLFADGVLGLAYMISDISGVDWLTQVLTHRHNMTLYPIDCLYTPHLYLYIISGPMMVCMELLISLDRLFAVSAPFIYFNLGPIYALCCVGFVIVLCTVTGTVVLITLVLRNPAGGKISIKCGPIVTLTTVHRFLIWWYRDFPVICIFTSFGLYVLITLIYGMKSVNDTENMKRQRRLTKSLIASALCTFFTFTIPIYLGITFSLKGWLSLGLMCFVVSNFDMLFNVAILLKRQPEIWKAIKALCHWKKLPPNLDSWQLRKNKRQKKKAKRQEPTGQKIKVSPAL